MLLGTVPTGSVWIVKTVRVLNNNGAAQVVQVYAQDSGNTVKAYLVTQTLASVTTVGVQGWDVLVAGDSLYAYIAAGPGDFWVSGSHLA